VDGMKLHTLYDDEKGNYYRLADNFRSCCECGELTNRMYQSWGEARCCGPRCFQDATDNVLHDL